MNLTVTWEQDVCFKAKSESQHSLLMDGPEDLGGKDLGMRPMEVLLSGMGGCTSFDVVTILKKSRQDVTACQAVISSKRAETVPKVFTDIHIHFKVTGKDLDEKKVARAIELSATKYCSASIMLSKSVNITHGYEIIAA
jgi:putative redox protein